MHTITVLTATLLPILLAITIGGGWLIAWSAMRPVEKILAAVDGISAGEDLSARLNMQRGPREMRRLSAAFDRMFARLEKAFDTERQFTSDASHELRTPITVILAECDRAKRIVRPSAVAFSSTQPFSSCTKPFARSTWPHAGSVKRAGIFCSSCWHERPSSKK